MKNWPGYLTPKRPESRRYELPGGAFVDVPVKAVPPQYDPTLCSFDGCNYMGRPRMCSRCGRQPPQAERLSELLKPMPHVVRACVEGGGHVFSDEGVCHACGLTRPSESPRPLAKDEAWKLKWKDRARAPSEYNAKAANWPWCWDWLAKA